MAHTKMFKEEKRKCVKHLVLVERCREDEEMLVQLLFLYNLLSNNNRPPTTHYELMFQINKRYRMDLQNVKLVQFFHIVRRDPFGIRNLSSSKEERKNLYSTLSIVDNTINKNKRIIRI